jgi:hypothetical protein
MNNVIFQYIKNRKNQRVGVVVATGLRRVGWSLCKTHMIEDWDAAPPKRIKVDTFNKKRGFDIACGRANQENPVTDLDLVPQSARKLFVEMTNRAERYFSPKPVVPVEPLLVVAELA